MIERIKGLMVGGGAGWVLWLMLGLSVVSVVVMVERAWLYWTLRDDIGGLMRDLAKLLRSGERDAAIKRLEASPSAEAAVVIAGLLEAGAGPEAAEEAILSATSIERTRLERRLAFLGTLGNNAPFIGLLGTVIGIVGAFEELGKSAAADATARIAPQAVMSNIAEALVATAVGLCVAIPAVAAFNAFQRVVKTTLANTEALAHVLLSHLKGA
jgi:biopolymer transport protein ExbB